MEEQKLYKVYEHWTPDNEVYVGITSMNMKKRWQPSNYKRTALEPYINEFGWENITHQVIFTTPDRAEALKKEDELIQYYRELGICINKQRSGLVKAKDEKAYYQQYYQNHNEELKAYKHQWYLKKKAS